MIALKRQSFWLSSDCSATIRVVDSFLRVISSGFLTVAVLVGDV